MIRIIYALIISFLFFISFGCEKKEKQSTNKTQKNLKKPLDNYSKLDVCGCNKEAMGIIDLAREIRDTFQSIGELKKQKQSVKEIQGLASDYTKLLNSCFNRHASKMFIPSDCNNLKLLDQKKSELIDLGIQLEQGGKIKL
tara:strand:+ start:1907 stop:2329 length:423 start_codon:yes stop_codon:yes gene_type:complete